MKVSERVRTVPPAPSRRGWVWWGLGGIVLAALVGALALSGEDPRGAPMPDQVSVELSGEALPLFSGDPASDSAIGLPMPSMTGADFEGKPVSIVPGGRPMVVLFLAHWCPHCQREVPKVQTYQDQVGFPAGVDFYSVATSNSSSQPNWPPSAWLAREGWTFPVLVDDQESRAFQAAGRGAFPYFVFVDSAGNVALRLSGEQDPLMLASIMEQLASS